MVFLGWDCYGIVYSLVHQKQVRSNGQHKLYWKLIRRMAEFGVSHGSEETIDDLMDATHKFFKAFYAGGKSTTKMSTQEMHLFYETCQRHSILMLGVSGMDEDLKEFDHGFKSE